ncbi:hypothetical protein QBZ16_003490 [Prototheca wickerhamii]|uniref:CLAC channel n=1 Tax=Prototheca wickerhamii TaxID=3111 RepID=A0AAD9IL54_PROWI|nr:hypothetical protein QBZ16_003490 [Prototheca wickerhamii]
MAHGPVPLGIVLFSLCVTLVAEALCWLMVYRTRSYRSLKENLEQQTKRVNEAKTAPSSTKKAVKKKEAKLESWRTEASAKVAGFNLRTGLITLVVMMLSFRMVSKIFGSVPVARLPFEPPPFLQKLTHRGISGADPRECSSLFIYVLCQASIKVLTSKVLGLAPGREWASLKPQTPPGFMGLKND